MRIVSDFHDYYDIGMSEGQDQSLIYNRHPIVEEREFSPFSSIYSGQRTYSLSGSSLYVRSYTIGFCGKMYKALELNTVENGSRNDKEGRSTRKLAFNLRDVDSYVRLHYPKHYTDYLEKNWRASNNWSREQRQHSFDSFFNGYHLRKRWEKTAPPSESELFKNEQWCRSWFDKHRSPIFVAELSTVTNQCGCRITYNAQLKPLEFFRVFDPYQAYQEVAMWLSNQAVPLKPIPEMTDEIKIQSKGFDKFSFRKAKTKKK